VLTTALRVHLLSSAAAVQPKAIVWPPSCASAMSIAPMVGRNSCCLRSTGQQAQGKEVAFRADAGRQLVADQLAAAVGENRRTTHQTSAYYWLLLAESHLTRQLFAAMLRKITMPPAPAG
jgi:hypothetical protein